MASDVNNGCTHRIVWSAWQRRPVADVVREVLDPDQILQPVEKPDVDVE